MSIDTAKVIIAILATAVMGLWALYYGTYMSEHHPAPPCEDCGTLYG